MTHASILLRLLLSLALVFNGIAGAVASTSMHAGPEHGAVLPEPDQQASQPTSCQEHPGVAAAMATDSPAMAESPADAQPASDCCKSGECRCDCVPQSQIAIAAALFPEPAIVHSTSARAVEPGYAAVPLPHLIRPPIG